MRKKKGGNPNADNTCDLLSLLLTRSQQDDAIEASLSPNVLVNNETLSATNGCQDYDFNKNAVNYLYLQNIRGGKLNKMTRSDNIFMEGGCYTCPKGKRRLVAFSRTFVVIIPSLYNKFKNGKMKNFDKTVKNLTKSDEKPKNKSRKKKKLKKSKRKRKKKKVDNKINYTKIRNIDISYN